ncbi:MAG TPA: type II toxin-antitoxin system prevent-host-death family antitoxin [Thermomicrobiales bacterium]|nr:type II toxin-antitoxin system prevent-host-death family antitoxin [Thermomicrobiales bacterium]
MVKTMSARDVRAKFAGLLDAVSSTGEPVIAEKRGKPAAVFISPEEFVRYRQQMVERAWATIECLQERNADKDPEEVLRDVTAEVEAVRQGMYDAQRTH